MPLSYYMEVIMAKKNNEITKTTPKYKAEKCKVLAYNSNTLELDIEFKGYGIRLSNISDITSDMVLIKYYGEIGKANFSCGL